MTVEVIVVLDAGGKIPIGELPTGSTGTTVPLGNHTHAGGSGDMSKAVYDPNDDGVIVKAQLDPSLANTSGTNTGDQTLAGLGGIAHSLATAINDFLVASGAGAFVKKTLTETKAILDWAADIATHAGLTTGVHGVGAGTVAKVGDIATDTNLSANAQDAITKRHTQNTDTDLEATFEASLKNTDNHTSGATNKVYTATEQTKLAGIQAGAQVNNISDVNATDLTDGGQTTLHSHAGGGALPTPIAVTLWQDAALTAWTNMPAALTEFRAVLNTRTKLDLTSATNSRITVRIGVAPVANAKIKVQYSTNETTWIDLCSVTMPATANLTNVGVWTAVPAGAKADVFIRVVGIDGNGVADPTFGLITLQVK